MESYRLVDGGNTLQLEVMVEDPATFIKPVHFRMNYRKAQGPLVEDRCAEGESLNPFGQKEEPIPTANTPDF